MTATTDTQSDAPTTSPRPGRNDLREVLTVALTHHREGRLADAERIYRRVLAVDADQPDALHLLGVLALDHERSAEAIDLLTRAVAAAPEGAAIHNALGTAYRRCGQTDAAVAAYRQAVELEPSRPEFRTNLAAALGEIGAHDEAVSHVTEALERAPSFADAHFVLGVLHRARHDYAAAEACFARAATSPSMAAVALLNLGNTRRDLGRLPDAIEAYRTVLAVDPGHVGARFALGVTYQAVGRAEEALATLGALVEHVPGHRDAWFHLGLLAHQAGATPVALDAYLCAQRLGLDTVALHTNLGLALCQLGRLDDAAVAQSRAVALEPGDGSLRLDLAITLRRASRLDEAIAACEAAIAIDPTQAAPHSLLGGIRMLQHRHDDALVAHGRARTLEPDSPIVLNEYANALMDDGDIEQALSLYRGAIARAPGRPELHLHLALALLAQGRLAEGWVEYAWRHAVAGAHPVWAGPGAPWRGEPLEGRRVLVWREQGLGDEIMFASCLQDLITAGARVVLLGTPRLRALYQRAIPDLIVIDPNGESARDDLEADYHAAIGTLPRWLRSRIDDFPERRVCLQPDSRRVDAWRERLRKLGDGPMIGVCWRSGLLTPTRRSAYAPLTAWAPLLQTPTATFINLQYDECSAELDAIKRVLGVTVHRWPSIDLRNDLDEAAALTAALDLVISAPTASGELAAAMGVPTWRIVDERDWTMLGTARRPWFPSMEVFARAPRESWSALMSHVADRLARHVPSSTPTH